MELEKALLFKIKDMNFEFRILNETDMSQNYVDGLKEQNEYMENIPDHVNVSSKKNA